MLAGGECSTGCVIIQAAPTAGSRAVCCACWRLAQPAPAYHPGLQHLIECPPLVLLSSLAGRRRANERRRLLHFKHRADASASRAGAAEQRPAGACLGDKGREQPRLMRSRPHDAVRSPSGHRERVATAPKAHRGLWHAASPLAGRLEPAGRRDLTGTLSA